MTLKSKASDNQSCICGALQLAVAGGQYQEITFIESDGISFALQFKFDFTGVNVFTLLRTTLKPCFVYCLFRGVFLLDILQSLPTSMKFFVKCILYLEQIIVVVVSRINLSSDICCSCKKGRTSSQHFVNVLNTVWWSIPSSVAAAPSGSVHSKKPLGLIRI